MEEEIQTLRHVLASKVRASQELKRKLGFSVWKEFQDDMSQGIRNVKESNVYVFLIIIQIILYVKLTFVFYQLLYHFSKFLFMNATYLQIIQLV